MGERREVLAEAATDYVLEHGLLDLSLRPLAAALGTSDRMLLYHFSDKNDLVATVLRVSNDRSVAAIRELRAVAATSRRRCSTSGPWSARPSRRAASGSTSRRRPSGCSAPSRSPRWSAEANEVWLGGARRPPRRLGMRPADGRARGPAGGGGVHGPAARRAARAAVEIGRSVGDLADAVGVGWDLASA